MIALITFLISTTGLLLLSLLFWEIRLKSHKYHLKSTAIIQEALLIYSIMHQWSMMA